MNPSMKAEFKDQRYSIRRCPRCHTRRRIYRTGTTFRTQRLYGVRRERPYASWACSQGHRWATILGDSALMSELLTDVYAPTIEDAINAVNPLREMFK